MSDLKIVQEINQEEVLDINRETYDHYNPEKLTFKAQPGISEQDVRKISQDKNEPEWMLQKRLTGFRLFQKKETPNWGPDISDLDLLLSEVIRVLKNDAYFVAVLFEGEVREWQRQKEINNFKGHVKIDT